MCGPNAGYYDAIQHQEDCESLLMCEPLPPLPPSPYPEVPAEQPLWEVNVGNVDDLSEQEVNLILNMQSNKALLLAGRAFVKQGITSADFGTICANMACAYKATGTLLYLVLCTHPDIAYAVGVLCRFNACPGPKHWQAVKHLMQYVQGILDYKIEYSTDTAASSPSPFIAFADADHSSNLDNGQLTTGSILLVTSGTVSWMSKLQTIVALSSMEAEFVAASETGHELCWLRNFLADIGMPQSIPLMLNLDNQSAILVSKQPEHMGCLKHLDQHWFWLQQAIYNSKIRLIYIPSSNMAADLLTKTLKHNAVDKLRHKMGLVGEFS
ncbi:hypothetical protein E4T56_gene10740 [Termitomyces sp. T112]|nr:hypothetical protein E4T56_gene10740 [Termitomyces sp. T112]